MKIAEFIKSKKGIATLIIAVVAIAAIVIAVVANTGKTKKTAETTTKETESTTTEETTTAKETEKETSDPNLKGDKMYSYLTGEPVSKKIGQKRPYAIMINNISDAIPQSGISQADVIYEATVEGSITRMMAVFEDFSKVKKIGSVRSCRFYFAYWATEWDAIYCHFGQSGYALNFLDSGKVDALGARDDTAYVTYYRDSAKVAPHNVYTTKDNLDNGTSAKKYSTSYSKNYKGHFNFTKYGTSVKLQNAKNANSVYTNYKINSSYFVYDKNTKLYNRFQYGQKHIDEVNGEQLKCKNIIIEQADAPLFDDGKSVNFKIVGSGKGTFITEGKAIPITWKKKNSTAITHFYDASGKEIQLNTGKTFICVMPTDQSITIK